MRIIPVIDLLNGFAVHAIKGDRKNYRPLHSILCSQPDPITIARSFRTQLGLKELYLADLDCIQYRDSAKHRRLISSLATNESMDIILDAGVSEIEAAIDWINAGIHKIVIGSETLRALSVIAQIPQTLDKNRIVFSLDLQSGAILSQCSEFAALSPIEALDLLQSAGWQEVILLDLTRVGSGMGIDRNLVAETRRRFPEMNLLVGGGIAGPEQMSELWESGVAGVLLATALHNGTITTQNISAMQEPQKKRCPAFTAGH